MIEQSTRIFPSISFIIVAVIGVLYFMNIVSGTLGIVLLVLAAFCNYKNICAV